MTYFGELCRAMERVALESNAVFMGQAVGCEGTAMRKTLAGLPAEKLLELPVFEDTQMGMATGMALGGLLPVCIFPRWNFLLLAANQLVNHIDKLPTMSGGGFMPKVIIRVGVGSRYPLDPGPQHIGDFTYAFGLMTETIKVVALERDERIVPEYERALDREGSTILVERMDLYGDMKR